MEFPEIRDMAESLKRRLELLMASGISGIPERKGSGSIVRSGCPADWVIFSGPLSEAVLFAPCCHDGWKGVLFGIWPLGKAVAVWGVPVSGPLGDNPFGAEPLSQLEKMLNWLAEQVKADAPVVSRPHVVMAGRCPQAGGYSESEAAKACFAGIAGLSGAEGVLIMGELAGRALLQTADLGAGRGRVHKDGGRSIVATYSPDALLKDQELKKKAHADLKLLISAL